MAKWWTKKLGVQCFVMLAEWSELPESGYHDTKSKRETA
jgi:hypothetical protein